MENNTEPPSMQTGLTRRLFLGGVAAAGAPVAVMAAANDVLATREEMGRYYAFLWAEHCAVAEALGMPALNLVFAHQNGRMEAYHSSCDPGSLERRAKAVLEVAA